MWLRRLKTFEYKKKYILGHHGSLIRLELLSIHTYYFLLGSGKNLNNLFKYKKDDNDNKQFPQKIETIPKY